jgi:diguanylate cyclase (GGDEF)-like protein
MGCAKKQSPTTVLQGVAPFRYLLTHAAAGFVCGYLVLHPLSMFIHAITDTSEKHVHHVLTQQIADALTVEHIPMGLFFALIGGIIGLLLGLSRFRLQRLYEAAIVLANVDELTQLSNRRHFEEQLERETERARRSGMPCSLLMIDVDNFKAFNDAHGHLRGDDVLRYTAENIQSTVRTIDVAARLGGDEFGVLMPQTSRDEAVTAGERMRALFARRFAEMSPAVTLSVGAAEMPADADAALDLLARADQAVYLAKRMGKNRVATLGRVPPDLHRCRKHTLAEDVP